MDPFAGARRRQYAGLAEDDEEQVLGETKYAHWFRQRNVRMLLIVVAAMALVLGVVLAIALPLALRDDSSSSDDSKPAFEFDDILTTSAESLFTTWLCPTSPSPSASFAYRDTEGNIVRQFVTNTTKTFPDPVNQEVLFNKSGFIAADPSSNDWANSIGVYFVSPEASHIIFAVNQTQRWRYSYFANFLVYDIGSQTAEPLDEQHKRLMNPLWSPTNDRIAFVRDNNIYLRNLSNQGSEAILQITSDGTPGRLSELTSISRVDGTSIVNGVNSWVYEEDVLYASTAMWWSPDGAHLAFFKVNETEVPQYLMPIYDGSAYPRIENLAFPKAGFPNPKVAVAIFSVASNETAFLDWSDSGKYEYVNGIWWVDPTTVAVRGLNRLQNEEKTTLFNVNDGTSRVLFTQTSKAWVPSLSSLTFLPETDGSVRYFVDLVANSKSFLQVGLFNYSSGAFVRLLSDPTDSATWEVTQINQWIPSARMLVYSSAEVSPIERHIYSQVIEDTTGATKANITPSQGWWSATFSPCGDFFTLNFRGNGDLLNVPTTQIRSIRQPGFGVVMVTNQKLQAKISSLSLARKEFLMIPNAAGEEMAASILYPPKFDKGRKYPLLINVYGGPGSQEVTMDYPLLANQRKAFDLYMAGKGYIVVQADGRGTGARGLDWTHAVYLKLGVLEAEDQLAAAKYFGGLPYVDSSRIGIWGWSYGGLMAAFTGSAPEADGVIKLAMSVAPGVDWRFADTAYVERYMHTPEINPSGYANSTLLGRVEGFRHLKYLIAQGTADDNVHLQQAAELSKVLVQAGIDFVQMYYTDSAHSINYGNGRPHLWKLLSRFVIDNL